MPLETFVFQQDPFSYGGTDRFYSKTLKRTLSSAGFDSSTNLEYSSPEENRVKEMESNNSSGQETRPETEAGSSGRRKKRRCKAVKNQAEIDHQRMAHIDLERKRRKQMNDYMSVLRSMMPPSYVQRGDQASIVGGAINYVKELEQMVQSLEAHKRTKKQFSTINAITSDLFSDFFTFPQYSDRAVADIQVTMIESHANVKILSRNHPNQLLKIVAAFYSLRLLVLHLNVTTVGDMVLYSLSVKVEEECQMSTVNEIAAAVYEYVARIQEEAVVSDFSSHSQLIN